METLTSFNVLEQKENGLRYFKLFADVYPTQLNAARTGTTRKD